MVEEMEALDKNWAWELVKFSNGRKLVGRKWVFQKNFNAKGRVEKEFYMENVIFLSMVFLFQSSPCGVFQMHNCH